jgi:hypothetical protein
MRIFPIVLSGTTLLLASCTSMPKHDAHAFNEVVFVDDVLNNWHLAASQGEFDAYFDAMTDDSVFLGTDASERWTKDQFMGYAREPFSDGSGWTYLPTERFVAFDDDRRTAWVDELLTNEKYGTLRGTAVLILEGDAWKIAHYSLTFLIPNEKAGEVVESIHAD